MSSSAALSRRHLTLGVVGALFDYCEHAFRTVLPNIKKTSSSANYVKWEDILGQLVLWGEGFSVSRRELDLIFVQTGHKSGHVRESTCIALCNIGKVLNTHGKNIASEDVDSNQSQLEDLLLLTAEHMPNIKKLVEFELNFDDEASDDGSSNEIMFEDIKDSVDALMDLIPFIEELFDSWYTVREKDPSLILNLGIESLVKSPVQSSEEKVSGKKALESLSASLSGDKRPFYKFLRENFPKMDPGFLLNLEHVNCRTQKTLEQCDYSSVDKDAGTFLNESCSPAEKMTILQPYSCTKTSCEKSLASFECANDWLAHEFGNHRPTFRSMWQCPGMECINSYPSREDLERHLSRRHGAKYLSAFKKISSLESCRTRCQLSKVSCPFCETEISENRESFLNHVGDHFKEISWCAFGLYISNKDQVSKEKTLVQDQEPMSQFEKGPPSPPTSFPQDYTLPSWVSVNQIPMIWYSPDGRPTISGHSSQIPKEAAGRKPTQYLSEDAFGFFDYCTQLALKSRPDLDLGVILNVQVAIFLQELRNELQIWRARYIESTVKPSRTRELPTPAFDAAWREKVSKFLTIDAPCLPISASNKISPDRENEEEGEDGPGSRANGWVRCLFYENDPSKYSQCIEKSYKRVSELRRHIKTHTLPHHCSRCGYRTAEERRLASHKCEAGNRKRYSPVTPEDAIMHEKLSRMGIKVSDMRIILFGEDTEKKESPHRKTVSPVIPGISIEDLLTSE